MSGQTLRSGPEKTLWDSLFENEMNTLVRDAKLHFEEYLHLEFCMSYYILISLERIIKPLFDLSFTTSSRPRFLPPGCHSGWC